MPKFTLVEQPDSIATNLGNNEQVGVDTEFMRERTYYAELCLVQIAAAEAIYCVDPLCDGDMHSFWDALMADTWVVHSGRQDIEVVYQTARRMPAAVFDTQVAAGLLGFAPQIGYAALVRELFGIAIDKSHTRANWLRRPLPDEFLDYAAEDVEHLLPAFERLAEDLDRKGRLSWAAEDSMQLLDTALYEIDPAQAIDRLKGAKNLRGSKRAAAARLATWRESEAMRVNRPRQWILKDRALLEIANAMPSSIDEFARINELPAGVVRRSGKQLLRLLHESTREGSHYQPPAAPSESQKSLLKSMQQHVAECANDLGIAAETVASKRDLSAAILSGNHESKVLKGWRRPLVGERLLELL